MKIKDLRNPHGVKSEHDPFGTLFTAKDEHGTIGLYCGSHCLYVPNPSIQEREIVHENATKEDVESYGKKWA